MCSLQLEPTTTTTASPSQPSRRRGGAPKGNTNALKHGRASIRVQKLRAVIRAAQISIEVGGEDDPANLPLEYRNALRWSREEMASLQIAVLKRAQVIVWRLNVVRALASGRSAPPPPNAFLSRRESGLYAIYVQQRRLLRGSVDWAPDGFASDKESIGHNAAIAYAELEHWQFAADALPPEMLTQIPIDIDKEMAELSSLAAFAPLATLVPDARIRDGLREDFEATPPFDFTRSAKTTRQPPLRIGPPSVSASKGRGTTEQQNNTTTDYDEWLEATKGEGFLFPEGLAELAGYRPPGHVPGSWPADNEPPTPRSQSADSEPPISDREIEAERAYAWKFIDKLKEQAAVDPGAKAGT